MPISNRHKIMARNIKIELYSHDRDFIVDLIYYGLQETVLKKLKQARPNKHGIITCAVDEYALRDMIGYLSLEANHNKKNLYKNGPVILLTCWNYTNSFNPDS